MSLLKSFLGLTTAASLLSATAFAATPAAKPGKKIKSQKISAVSKVAAPAVAAPTSVTAAPAPAVAAKPLPISLSALSLLYGPQVSDITSAQTSDDGIEAKTALTSRNFVSVGYKLSERMSVTPTLDFNYDLTDPARTGERFRWNDAYVKLSRGGLIEKSIRGNDAALDGDLRYFAPTSLGARQSDTIGAVRMTLSPSVVFGKSGFSFTADTFAKYWLQTQDKNPVTKSSLPRLQFYAGPQMNYSVSDQMTAFILYEAIQTWDTAMLGKSQRNPKSSSMDVEPGMEIRVTDRFTLVPYLNWYTNQHLNTTSVNLNASFKVL